MEFAAQCLAEGASCQMQQTHGPPGATDVDPVAGGQFVHDLAISAENSSGFRAGHPHVNTGCQG